MINDNIEKILVKRLNEDEYKFTFVLKFMVEGNNSFENSITLNPKEVNKNTYIKNKMLYYSNSYIGNLNLSIDFKIKIIRRYKGRKLMLYNYKIKQLGIDIV